MLLLFVMVRHLPLFSLLDSFHGLAMFSLLTKFQSLAGLSLLDMGYGWLFLLAVLETRLVAPRLVKDQNNLKLER